MSYVSRYNGITDQTGINGNISSDPDFFDFYAGNGLLNTSSPCIDTGDPASPLDPDGTQADMGAIPYDHSTETPLVLLADVMNAQCGGGYNGAIDLTISGGIPPYTIMWSNGSSGEDISGLGAGLYSVTVSDNGGHGGTGNLKYRPAACWGEG